jgi:hypothetical protein
MAGAVKKRAETGKAPYHKDFEPHGGEWRELEID